MVAWVVSRSFFLEGSKASISTKRISHHLGFRGNTTQPGQKVFMSKNAEKIRLLFPSITDDITFISTILKPILAMGQISVLKENTKYSDITLTGGGD